MGMFSKMTIMKVFEVVWAVSGFSGTVGFWSLKEISHFRKFRKVDFTVVNTTSDVNTTSMLTTSRSSRSSCQRRRALCHDASAS